MSMLISFLGGAVIGYFGHHWNRSILEMVAALFLFTTFVAPQLARLLGGE